MYDVWAVWFGGWKEQHFIFHFRSSVLLHVPDRDYYNVYLLSVCLRVCLCYLLASIHSSENWTLIFIWVNPFLILAHMVPVALILLNSKTEHVIHPGLNRRSYPSDDNDYFWEVLGIRTNVMQWQSWGFCCGSWKGANVVSTVTGKHLVRKPDWEWSQHCRKLSWEMARECDLMN